MSQDLSSVYDSESSSYEYDSATSSSRDDGSLEAPRVSASNDVERTFKSSSLHSSPNGSSPQPQAKNSEDRDSSCDQPFGHSTPAVQKPQVKADASGRGLKNNANNFKCSVQNCSRDVSSSDANFDPSDDSDHGIPAQFSGIAVAKEVKNIRNESSGEEIRRGSVKPHLPIPFPERDVKQSRTSMGDCGSTRESKPCSFLRPKTQVAQKTDAAYRRASKSGAHKNPVDLFHFPSNISLRPKVSTTLEDVPEELNPILYRLKPGTRGDRSTREVMFDVMKKCRSDPSSLLKYLESNAHVITWSDGSKTLSVGSEEFSMIMDYEASSHFVFRKGDDIQTCETAVRSTYRVQPFSTSAARERVASASAAALAASSGDTGKQGGRTLMQMDPETERLAAVDRKKESRRVQQKNRLEEKRRREQAKSRRHTMSTARSNQKICMKASELDNKTDDEHTRRIVEKNRKSKRLVREVSPDKVYRKRRKAGRRRVLRVEDENSDNG